MSKIEASELTLNTNGKLYHLNIGPEDVADHIILVGDQDRAYVVASFFDEKIFETRHREFVTITGKYKNKLISVISHGIGCDNIDIVLTELDAAVNINLKTREVNKNLKSLNIIRVGTCGALQTSTKVGSALISNFAIGMDGVANFYDILWSEQELHLLKLFINKTKWPTSLATPYLVKADEQLTNCLKGLGDKGITITANGFYGPQGREIRLPLKHSNLINRIEEFKNKGEKVLNFEMETSALLALSKGLGHKAVTICLVLANRKTGDFDSNFQNNMKVLVKNVMNRLLAC